MSGWFAVQRDFFDHKLFKKEPFTEREAWLWIIANAAWEQTTHRIEREVLIVERGSFYCTQRELAQRFQWGTTKIRNFLKLTQEQNMLVINNETKKTLVSVCNYEEYQSKQNNDKTTTKQPSSENKTTTKQRQNTKEEINNLTTNNITKDNKNIDDQKPISLFEDFWEAFDDKRGKANALKVWKSKNLDEISYDVISGAKIYVNQIRGSESKYWKQAQGWLNGERWNDEPQIQSSPTNVIGFQPNSNQVPSTGMMFLEMAKRAEEQGQ